MNDPFSPSLHSWTPGYGQENYPGIEGAYSGPPAVIEQTAVPVQAPAATPAPAKGGLPFNLSNLGDIKSIIDRMGGIEGVLSTMGKVQKFMATMQQMAPMLKLFMGKGKSDAPAISKGSAPRRRRRPSGSKSRRKKPTKRR
ncbi:tyrosine protein kinase [Cohnella terricola]|uniref:Tyrosine protein kinase n=1 Tax=Cohnella terricola TaxID=1289167 RepID=A0A559JTE7_9BACL|nr:tyrosine protein kinase [Cohnella terricola]TVY03158.1 tyrosine protein kinase [Cohnella terricola]